MAQVIADFLEAEAGIDHAAGACMAQGVGPLAFSRPGHSGEALFYDVLNGPAREGTEWSTGCQEQRPPIAAGPTLAQVVGNGVADLGLQGEHLLPGTLGSNDADGFLPPVDVIESEMPNLTGAQPIDGKQEKNGAVTQLVRLFPIAFGDNAADLIPCRSQGEPLLLVYPGCQNGIREARSYQATCLAVSKPRA